MQGCLSKEIKFYSVSFQVHDLLIFQCTTMICARLIIIILENELKYGSIIVLVDC